MKGKGGETNRMKEKEYQTETRKQKESFFFLLFVFFCFFKNNFRLKDFIVGWGIGFLLFREDLYPC